MKSSVNVNMEQVKENDGGSDDDSRSQNKDQSVNKRQDFSKNYRFDNDIMKKESKIWLKSCLRLQNIVQIILLSVVILNCVQIYFCKSELNILQAKAKKVESLFRNVFNKDLGQISTNDVLSTFSKVSLKFLNDLNAIFS